MEASIHGLRFSNIIQISCLPGIEQSFFFCLLKV